MFYVTTHISKKRILQFLCCLIIPAVITVFALAAKTKEKTPETNGATREQRVAFIKDCGFIADGNTEQICKNTTPSKDDTAYAGYIALQQNQGFSLDALEGQRVTQYTYKITNHPKSDDYIYANLLVHNGIIVGADIHDSRVGGFVKELRS